MHLLKYTRNSGYLVVQTPKSPPRYIVFRNRKDAENCKTYVKNFVTEYGKWPNFELSSDSKEIISKTDDIKFQGDLEIDEFSREFVLDLLKSVHIGMLYCLKFEAEKKINKYTLNISAQEIDQDECLPAYIEYITNLYKNQQ